MVPVIAQLVQGQGNEPICKPKDVICTLFQSCYSLSLVAAALHSAPGLPTIFFVHLGREISDYTGANVFPDDTSIHFS